MTRTGEAILEPAARVLDANWTGRSTKPAPALYPHLWSWDSAFIAIGNRHRNWTRAAAELVTLFDAQWTNGLVPHIVFDDIPGQYFPAADFWDSMSAPAAPRHAKTSGIIQPPIHATAVRLVASAAPDDQGRSMLQVLYPKLAAWHDYIYQQRCLNESLAEIWHPWESGMDNSPMWDGPLSKVQFDARDVGEYRRVDVDLADPADRPTKADYDCYIYLANMLKGHAYTPGDPSLLPFRVRDVLFNSALVRSGHDLAAIAEELGADGSKHRERTSATAAAINNRLWSNDLDMYTDEDLVAGSLIDQRIAGGCAPIYAGAVEGPRLATLLETMRSQFVAAGPHGGALIPTVPVTDPSFESTRYWRGPAWVNIQWMLIRGLRELGETDLAARLVDGIDATVGTAGMWEYYDPIDGSGHGSHRFSWTAALATDLALTRGT